MMEIPTRQDLVPASLSVAEYLTCAVGFSFFEKYAIALFVPWLGLNLTQNTTYVVRVFYCKHQLLRQMAERYLLFLLRLGEALLSFLKSFLSVHTKGSTLIFVRLVRGVAILSNLGLLRMFPVAHSKETANFLHPGRGCHVPYCFYIGWIRFTSLYNRTSKFHLPLSKGTFSKIHFDSSTLGETLEKGVVQPLNNGIKIRSP